MISKSIKEIRKEDCCGCRACELICPQKSICLCPDIEGFIYPKVKDTCIQCGLCLKVCPQITQDLRNIKEIYAVKSKNKHLQYRTSSGGIFAEICNHFIKKNAVIFGATYSNDFMSVYHCGGSDKYSILKFVGSKYVQSDTLNTFSEVKYLLNTGRIVVYSGVGCQIQALRNFLRKDYTNLFTIDILCHGVASPLIFKEYIRCMVKKFGKLKGINMKDKSNGWGKQSPRFDFVDNKTINDKYSSFWNKIYYSRTILRPSCYNCKFTRVQRSGDVTLGDFWGIEKFYPDFYDSNGVSLLFINSEKGEKVFGEIIDSVDFIKTSIDKCIQPVLLEPTKPANWRKDFWNIYKHLGFKEVAYKFWGLIFSNKIYLKINRIFNRIIFH